MLNWIRRKLYERNRAIFTYWDGQRLRRIDPLAAFRAIRAHERFDIDTHLDLANGGIDEAIQVTLEATREIFDVREYADGVGLTIDETMNLIGSFVYYLNALKKNGSPRPISPEPTAPESSVANCETTNALSDSGSTVSEQNCGAPAP